MAQASGQVHRLVDMEVQEVSLVDRAANKRRFLIVKRSEGMGDKGTSDAADGQSEQDAQRDADEGDTGDAEGGDTAGAVAVACDALEGLTRAVEQLQAGTGQGKVIGDVVQELRAAADLLQEQLGGDTAPDAPAAAPGATRADALVAVVGQLVSELRASRKAARSRADGEDDEPPDGGKPKGKSKKADEPEAPATGLAAIHGELKKISSHVEQQVRRIDRLEKRAGVPSSQPAGERPGRAPASASDDVSWPLDLNSPRSR
jgi:hypothetical protein